MIPITQIAEKIPSSLGLTAFLSIISDGSESVVTPIIKGTTYLTFVHSTAKASPDLQRLLFGNAKLFRKRRKYCLRTHIAIFKILYRFRNMIHFLRLLYLDVSI